MNVERKTQAARAAATGDALISAARRLFAERGYADVGTEEIVRAAGVTRGALYHHVPDKRAGVAAWLDACAEPEVHRIMLTDAPAVLGWERWVEISNRHNMGLAQALLEAAMYLARAADQRVARVEIGYVMDQLLRGLPTDELSRPSAEGRARSRRRGEPSAGARGRP